MLMTATDTPASLLQAEFEKRLRRNARYSLRAFARDIGWAPSRLSEVMSGQAGVSRAHASQLGRKLDLTEQEREWLMDLADAAHARSPRARTQAQERLARNSLLQVHPGQRLQADAFRLVSDWYCFALLELLDVENCESEDPAWLARALGISPFQATQALERLERLGLTERNREGRIRPSQDYTFTTDGVPSEAIRESHRQILAKSAEVLDTQDVTRRDFSYTLLAFDPAEQKEAFEEIKKFRRAFAKRFGNGARKRKVNVLAIQFYSVDQLTHSETDV